MQLNYIKKKYQGRRMELLVTGFVIIVTIISIYSYSSGAAGFGQTVTGAPFNGGQTCAKCHGGGSYSSILTTRLYQGNQTFVTSYIPNKQYYFVINFRHTAGAVKHGFQTTCATTTGNVNINRWVGIPDNIANRVVSARNYVEHTTPLTSDTVVIPWRAPAAGTGSVTFWTAANFANGTGGTGGDEVKAVSITIAENTNAIADNSNNDADNATSKLNPHYSLKIYHLSGTNRLLFYNDNKAQQVRIFYSDINGNILYHNTVQASEGNNVWPLYSFRGKGVIIINAITEDGVRTSLKVNGQ